MANDMFDGIEDAQVKLPWFDEGTYKCQVDSVKAFRGKKPPIKQFFGAEFTILEATGPAGHNAKGTRASRSIAMDGSPYGLAEAKELCAAILGKPVGDITRQDPTNLTDPKNPAKGRVIIVTGTKISKKDGGDFVKYSYQGVPK